MESLHNKNTSSSESTADINIIVKDSSTLSKNTSVESDGDEKQREMDILTNAINQSESLVDDSIENAITALDSSSVHCSTSEQDKEAKTGDRNEMIECDNTLENTVTSPVNTDYIDTGHIDRLTSLSSESFVPRRFIDLLFARVHVKGESRLAHEVHVFFLHCFIKR